MAYEATERRMLADIEFLLTQLHLMEQYQDKKRIEDICKRYKINPLGIYDFTHKPRLQGNELKR